MRSLLQWLEVNTECVLPAAALSQEPCLRALEALGVLEADAVEAVSCRECWRECGPLEVRVDELALQGAPKGTSAVVFCPDGMWLGARPVQQGAIGRDFRLTRRSLLAALRAANPTLDRSPERVDGAFEWVKSVRYAGRRAQVFFLCEATMHSLRALRASVGEPIVALSPDADFSVDQVRALERDGVAYLSVAQLLSDGSLALPFLWPRLAPDIFDDPKSDGWIAADLSLHFAQDASGAHCVQMNGSTLDSFAESDVLFAVLLRLASARARAKSWDRGGRVALEDIDRTAARKRLEEVRRRLSEATEHGTKIAGTHLVRSSGDGEVMLAVRPDRLSFDRSLLRFSSLQERELASAKSRKDKHHKDVSAGVAEAKRLVEISLRELFS